MFRYTAIVFFLALFARALCGSLAIPQNVAGVLKPQYNHLDSTQATLDRIESHISTVQDLWNQVVLQHFKEKVNWNEGQLTALKEVIEEQLDGLEQLHEELLKKDEKVVQTNFQEIGSRFFYIETNVTLNWFSAADTCRQMGGQLATIRSRNELSLIVPKLKWNSAYWLSLNDLSKEGEFISSVSGKPAPFLNWRKGQPDNYNGKEHCVQLINHYIYDCSCNDKRRFICEA